MRVVITGGAGFVGTHVGLSFRQRHPDADIVAFDNLQRRGSELNLSTLREHGIAFVHGDVREPADLEQLDGEFDVMIEASAEPSVHAGMGGSPRRVLDINLVGTLNCLEFCRRRVRDLIFLSTSRVYPIDALRRVAMREGATRFELEPGQSCPGISERGVSERFPLDGPRSYYGASKLASELLIQEYVAATSLRAVINRCGVIAGPGQFGKVDQGVFTMWVASHHFNNRLRYTGFGGSGKQVRDLLHPDDLCDLLHLQLGRIGDCSGQIYNVGGGRGISVSLLELTALCRDVTRRSTDIERISDTSSVDIPLYITDTGKVRDALGWTPSRDAATIVGDIHRWIVSNEVALRPILA